MRLWPTDKQILQTIKHSHHLACELPEFLKMIQPADISIEQNLHIPIGVHEKEVSMSKNQNGNDEEQNENIEPNLTAALTEVSQEMKHVSTAVLANLRSFNFFEMTLAI